MIAVNQQQQKLLNLAGFIILSLLVLFTLSNFFYQSGGSSETTQTIQKTGAKSDFEKYRKILQSDINSIIKSEIKSFSDKNKEKENTYDFEAFKQSLQYDMDAKISKELQKFKPQGQGKVYEKVKDLDVAERKRILVTGGAGFVGSHLVDKLMKQGHEVYVIDNFFTGRRSNIEHWIGHPNFELIHHDVTQPYMLEVSQIYHLACPASPPHYQYNPIKTIKTNTMGTLNMLGLARRVKARLLMASTSEVYGDPAIHPQVESYWGNVNPIGPRACYDEGKRISETMCYAYKHQENVEVRIARIFNTFGPRMHPNDGRVVSNFVIQALKGEDITIYGNGEQTRSFQYVEDLVDGLMTLMNGDYDQPVNLGNPEEFTIKQFAEYITELVGSKSKIAHKEKSKDDPQKRRPDITVAKKNLGWEPKWNVKDGLQQTINYFKTEVIEKEKKTKAGKQ